MGPSALQDGVPLPPQRAPNYKALMATMAVGQSFTCKGYKAAGSSWRASRVVYEYAREYGYSMVVRYEPGIGPARVRVWRVT